MPARIPKHFLFALLGTALLLAGAGCLEAADQTAGTVINGAVGTPLAALNQAKQVTADEQARLNRQAETTSNYVTVAMILTDGSVKPDNPDITVGPTIGCNDQVAMVQVSRASDSGQVVIDALNSLLAIKETTVDGLYDSLAMSSLTVADQAYTTDGQTTEIHLQGQVSSGGTCDDPRIKAQVEETVRRFHPDFKILLNGSESAWRCLGDMSGLCQ